MSTTAFAQIEREYAENEDRLADARDRIDAFRKTLPTWDLLKQPGRYVPAAQTDIRKRFDEIRRKQLPQGLDSPLE